MRADQSPVDSRRAAFPRRLGRYQIVGRIAAGGMAEVYLAAHGELAALRTPVAVKRVLPQLARDPSLVGMFLQEARIAALLDHPNLVRIFEIGCDAGEYFQAMELVQGAPLWALLNRRKEAAAAGPEREPPFDARLAAFVVAQAAAGLHHAHNLSDRAGNPLKLVHRDVSPQNILVSFEGAVKVIDFGIARSLGRMSWTQTGMVRGKCAYMSPEQARGHETDARADLFALGVVLWEAVTGRRLFERENPVATMHALVYEPIPLPSSLVPLSRDLEAIIMQALERNREKRQGSAMELNRQLDRFLAETGAVGPRELSAVMKRLFAEEAAEWKETLRTVLEAPMAGPARALELKARFFALVERLKPLWDRHWRVGLAALGVVAAVLVWLVAVEGLAPSSASPQPAAPAPAPPPEQPPAANPIDIETLPVPEPDFVAPPTEPPPMPPDGGVRAERRRSPKAVPARSRPPRPDRRPNPFR